MVMKIKRSAEFRFLGMVLDLSAAKVEYSTDSQTGLPSLSEKESGFFYSTCCGGNQPVLKRALFLHAALPQQVYFFNIFALR